MLYAVTRQFWPLFKYRDGYRYANDDSDDILKPLDLTPKLRPSVCEDLSQTPRILAVPTCHACPLLPSRVK